MVLSAWWTTFKKHRENLIRRKITNTYNLSIETTLKKLRENHKYKRKPKKTKKASGKPKNIVFKGFRPTLGYSFGLVCFFGFPEGLKQKQQNLRENQQYKRKPKKTTPNLGKTKKTIVFKGFRPTLGYGFGLVWFVAFPEGFFGCLKTFGKTTNTKDNQRTQTNT